jgi:hypothetical protein
LYLRISADPVAKSKTLPPQEIELRMFGSMRNKATVEKRQLFDE